MAAEHSPENTGSTGRTPSPASSPNPGSTGNPNTASNSSQDSRGGQPGLPRFHLRELLSRVWKGPEKWLGIAAVLLIGFCCITYSRPLAEYSSRLFTKNKYLALVDGMVNPFRNRHILLDSGLPIYDLKIDHKQYGELLAIAKRALQQGWMTDDMKIWVPAKFIADGEVHDVQVRLRGDLSRHWRNPKKSYRIKFGDEVIQDGGQVRKVEKFFHGKRQINLIVPHDKLFALGAFVNGVMRDKGLVVPDDRFVILRINGVLHGLYYEAEHFDKPLLAGHERPETTIFGLNTRPKKYDRYTKLGTPVVSDASYDLGSVRRQVEPLDDLGMRAMQVLIDHSLHPKPENLRRVRAVLDWDKYLYFRAMTTLCNTNHTRFGSDNLKLYYDASRGLLEPVPWDLLLTKMPREPATIDFYNSHGTDEIQKATLQDPALRLRRNQILWELVGDGGDSLLARYDRIAERLRLLVWADVLTTPVQAYKMDQVGKVLAHNIRRVHHVLSYSSGNLGYRLETPQRASLEFAALNFSGLRLNEITVADSSLFEGAYRLYRDSDDDGVLDADDELVGESVASGGEIVFAMDQEVLPEVTYGSDFIQNRYWEYFEPHAGRRRFFLSGKLGPEVRDPLLWTPPRLTARASNAVTGESIASRLLDDSESIPDNNIGITVWDGSDPWDLDAVERSLDEFLQDEPQFRASRSEPGAAELAGSVVLTGTVIVPRSVPLVVAAGADVTLEPGANLLAYGGLDCRGTAERRIRIHGRGGRAWGTFAAVRPPARVHVQHTDFSDGGQAQANGILFTGGFAVHEGDLDLLHSTFTHVQSEDAVNIKYGDILMSDCLVQGTASDAVDIDAGTGEVRRSRFVDIAGDALDVSYSTVTLRDNFIDHAGDKGISVGERSEPLVFNNLIRGSTIGVSCKDQSRARVAHCTFVGNKLAIEATRKKPMFGGGSGEFVNCVFAANDTLLREDHFCRRQVRLEHSVIDAANAAGSVRFVAPQAGDYRLAALSGKASVAPVGVPWLPLELRPQAPGIFAAPPPASAESTSPDRSAASVTAEGGATAAAGGTLAPASATRTAADAAPSSAALQLYKE